MKLLSLKLTNFRNYGKTVFNKPSVKNVLIGDNAQGKTNLIESIYFLSTLRSFRASKSGELVKWGEDWMFLNADVESGGLKNNIRIYYSAKKKALF